MTTEIQPRDDASILSWPQLATDTKQFAAATAAHAFFCSMADSQDAKARHGEKEPPGPEPFGFLPRLDARRRNHVVLLDGRRGSGKTAVMLRLLKDWADNVTEKPESDTLNFKLQKNALLVPVGLLDLAAVPQQGNLAARIAGMFERVVAAMEPRGVNDARTSPTPAWALQDGDTLKSREKWRKFVNSAALEWDRSLERRRATIDPEAYTVEVEQAELKGLHAPTCFREFIDALATDWERWFSRRATRPFFIVPIDDADMNPGRVVELFELTRRLWHPRVGYLLTGDSELFMRVLTAHFRAQLDVPVLGGPIRDGWLRVQLLPDPDHAAERLARDYYHKAVSLENCLKIPPLDGRVRLDFIKDALTHHPSLMINCPLIDYLDADDISPLALPSRWRELRDLRDYVRSRNKLSPDEFAFQVWQDALNDSWQGERVDEILRGAARHDGGLRFNELRSPLIIPVGHPTTVHRISSDGVTIGVAAFLDHKYRGLVGDATDLQKASEQYHTSGGITDPLLNATGTSRPPLRDVIELDESIVAAYMLMMNVAEVGAVGPWLMQSRYLRTSPSPELGRLATLPWSAPYADHLYDNQRLLREWNRRAPADLTDVVKLAKTYLSVVLSIRFGCSAELYEWPDFAAAVVDRFDVNTHHTSPTNEWHVRAMLLAAPEWGLPAQEANAWLRAVKEYATTKMKWDVLRGALLERRLAHVYSYLQPRPNNENDARELLDEIHRRARSLDYHWASLLESPLRDQPQLAVP